jgi:hypothetical protein
MNRTKLVIGVGSIALLGALGLSLRPGARVAERLESRPSAPETTEPFEAAPAEPALPPTARSPSPAPVAVAPTPATAAEAPSVAPEAGPPKPPEFKYSPNLERALELASDRAVLTARWSNEMSDPSWRSVTAARLHTTLVERGVDPNAVTEIDCRATICRFALRTSSKMKADVDGLIQAARAIDEQTWTMPEEQDAGYSVEVFFPREGYRLSGDGGRVDQPMKEATG